MARKAPKDYQRVHKPFEFRIGEVAYSLPTDLSVEAMADLAEAEDGSPSKMLAAIRALVPGEATEAIVKLPMADFREVLADWLDDMSGGESGNSGGSSTS